MKTVKLTMAQALIRFLDQQYVNRDGQVYKFVQGVMGIFGHGNVTGIGQALEDLETGLTFIQGHNEQGMVHAAAAYAKQRNRLGIYACTTSIGPGALNMVTAAATATVNRIPVLLLPGDVFACRQPDPVLQQLENPADYTATANDALKPVSRYWDRIDRPEQLMMACLNAMRVLTDPVDTGAVTLCLPQDVQAEAYEYPETFFEKRVYHLDRALPTAAAIGRAAELVCRKHRPLLVVGGGVHYAEATEGVRRFAEAFQIPVAETQAGKSALPWNHPLNVGGIGVTGTLAANRLAQRADLVIAVGTRLADFTTASKSAFQNPDVEFLTINVSRFDALKMNAVAVTADAREGLSALQAELLKRGYTGIPDHTAPADAGLQPMETAALKAMWDQETDHRYAAQHPDGLTQTCAIGVVNEGIGDDAVIVAAAGGLPGDLHRLWRSTEPKTYHLEYGFSCMGYEVSGAFGVKLADPARDVYALVGDGSYLMLHSELLTSLQEGVKINVVLFDNSGYQCIHNLQRGHGSAGFGNEFRYRDASTGRLTGPMVPIDFAAHAASMGIATYRATTAEELRQALAAAKLDKVSTLIDVKVVPGTGTDNYESWWRIGVAEVSTNPDVTAAYEHMRDQLQMIRPW